VQAVVVGFFERLQRRMPRIAAEYAPRTSRLIQDTCGARVVLGFKDVIGVERAGFWRRQFLNPFALEGY
jgi:hypothetical protein